MMADQLRLKPREIYVLAADRAATVRDRIQALPHDHGSKIELLMALEELNEIVALIPDDEPIQDEDEDEDEEADEDAGYPMGAPDTYTEVPVGTIEKTIAAMKREFN